LVWSNQMRPGPPVPGADYFRVFSPAWGLFYTPSKRSAPPEHGECSLRRRQVSM
jgi:hypothetical protein